jgi:CheY-like chemotaxis protein
VEDEMFVRIELATELSDSGWTVLEAGSARQALDVCESRQRVDLLVTDINLGRGMTGWDVARAFWLRDSSPPPAVIYLSANPDDPQHHVPASLFMRKPCRPSELSEACLHLRRDHQQVEA